MRNIPMVDLQGQYQQIKPEIDAAIQEILDSAYFIGAGIVKTFSENLADFLAAKHVIPCGNGTDALQIALMALDLQPGDEVITTPFTFVATAEVIALLQLKPVFVDVHPDTFNIDERLIEKAITEKTKCILPVHLFGQSCDMESIMNIAKKHNIYVVEDNAQAIGADFYFSDGRSQKVGTIGHIGTTSFFPAKNLGAFGDAGAIFTNDDALADKLRLICNHGSSIRYYHDAIGVNSRLDSLQAAVLNVKLKYLKNYTASRQTAAAFYTEQLNSDFGVITPVAATFSTHVYHQYTLRLKAVDREKVVKVLKEEGIASAIYYPIPLHLQNAYKNNGFKAGDFPVAEQLAKEVLSLPIHTEMTQEIQLYIINHLRKAVMSSTATENLLK
jgi:UDP-2-acetamido-2-deoxy-ribo-hexuluronate aminotransferase